MANETQTQTERKRIGIFVLQGNLVLTKDTEIDKDLKVEGDIVCKGGRFDLKVNGDINALNINAWNINALNINAGNIDAGDIDAGFILCETIKTKGKTIYKNIIQNRSAFKREEHKAII